MAQTPHPLDVIVDELDDYGRELVLIFKRDGKIDDQEHAALKRHRAIYGGTAEYRMREELGDSIKRNGLSRVTLDRARDVGLKIIDLDAERRKRDSNVIEFHPRNSNHAG